MLITDVRVDETLLRVGGWVGIASAAALAVTAPKLPPLYQSLDAAAITTCGSLSLAAGSRANKLSSTRRDFEFVQAQAFKDRAYKQLSNAVEKPQTTYTLDQLSGMSVPLLEPPIPEKVNPVQLMVENIKHNLIAAPTRSGKSLLLNAYIKGLYEKHGAGNFDLIILDPKTSAWLGLELLQGDQQIVHYVDVSEIDRTNQIVASVNLKMAERVADRQRLLMAGKPIVDYRPLYFIFDEYTDSFGFMAKNGNGAVKMLQADMGSLASKGAGLQVFCTIVGQTPNCDEIGFSAPSRDNFGIMALGSPKGGYSAISKMLTTENIIPKDDAKELKEDWKGLKEEGGYIFLTNIGGGFTISQSPNLSRFESMRLVESPEISTISTPTPTPLDPGFLPSEAVENFDRNSETVTYQAAKLKQPKSAIERISVENFDISTEIETISTLEQAAIERIEEWLKGKDAQKIHALLGSQLGQVRPDTGKPWTKSTLLQDKLGLKSERYTAIGKPLWDYLESQYGVIG